jgi:hypothetical protein
VPHSVILSAAVAIDVPSLHNFLEILLGLGSEYGSDDADDFSLSRECFFIGDDAGTNTAPKLMSPNLSPTNRTINCC